MHTWNRATDRLRLTVKGYAIYSAFVWIYVHMLITNPLALLVGGGKGLHIRDFLLKNMLRKSTFYLLTRPCYASLITVHVFCSSVTSNAENDQLLLTLTGLHNFSTTKLKIFQGYFRRLVITTIITIMQIILENNNQITTVPDTYDFNSYIILASKSAEIQSRERLNGTVIQKY